jgi:hypothetical protein
MSGIDDQKAEIKLVMISNQLCANKRSRVYQNLIDYTLVLDLVPNHLHFLHEWVGGFIYDMVS